MSDYGGGDWEKIWDGLFWRFIDQHPEFFKSNQRTSMLYHSFKRMPVEKRRLHIKNAEAFIEQTLNVV